MTKGSQTKQLGDVCEVFADGDWVESKDQSADGIRLIQTGNVGEGVFKDRGEKARYISEATFKRLRCTEIFEGDCLISRLPDPVGRSCILPETGERMITAVDCTIVRFKPNELLPEFFNFYSQSADYLTTVAKECTGTTRSRISRSNLALTPIPVPPLAIQQRIVGLLDEAFAGLATAKANAERNDQNARALFENHLQTVFNQRSPGWVDRRLGDVFDIGSSKRIRESEWTSTGVPFYGGKEIVKLSKYGTAVSDAYISEAKYREYSSKYDMPRKGDILVTARGTIGVGYVVKEGDKFYYKDGNIISFRERIPTNPLFVLYAFRSKLLMEQFADLTGATVTHLPIERAKELILKMPILTTQNSVVEHLGSMETETQRLATLYERKLTALEALKKSLLHEAFTGQLTAAA
jgi:type I restriction enzyme S subunit